MPIALQLLITYFYLKRKFTFARHNTWRTDFVRRRKAVRWSEKLFSEKALKIPFGIKLVLLRALTIPGGIKTVL